jgi:hypothetical protein
LPALSIRGQRLRPTITSFKDRGLLAPRAKRTTSAAVFLLPGQKQRPRPPRLKLRNPPLRYIQNDPCWTIMTSKCIGFATSSQLWPSPSLHRQAIARFRSGSIASYPPGSDESVLDYSTGRGHLFRQGEVNRSAMLPDKSLHGRDLQNHNHFIPKSAGVHCPFTSVGGKSNDSENDSDPACGTART